MTDEANPRPVVNKRADTRKFVVGVALILISLVMGKIVLVPILVFPGDVPWLVGSVIFYAVSWIIIIVGVVLAGREGYRLAVRIYKDYQRKALGKVRDHGRRAARGAVVVMKKPIEGGRKLAARTAEARERARARRSERKHEKRQKRQRG
jgi:hypothetical protein